MFVITADQLGSRTHDDLVPQALSRIAQLGGSALLLEPARTAGDEVQALLDDADATLAIALDLTRAGAWHVGLGVGSAEQPLPDDVRAGRGSAFVGAREAVERAKRSPARLAASDADSEALLRLLIDLRDRRSEEGWEVYDLLADGLTQSDAAKRLGISAGAVSRRATAAGLRVEEAAIPALARVLGAADERAD